MPLSAPSRRVLQHVRDIRFRSFEREDGLLDIEGELVDEKPHDIVLHGEHPVPAHVPIHHMWIRATIDGKFRVVAIEAAMDRHPLGHCPEAARALQKMVGQQMGRGWRKAINENLGTVAGCTHLRELLANMATAAFQTNHQAFYPEDPSLPPVNLGQCLGWDFNGPGVARYFPQFIGYEPAKRAGEASKNVAINQQE